jgi:uncharacterized protein (TIGR02186 family)
MKTNYKAYIFILLIALWIQGGNAKGATLDLNLTPERVDIGTFYNGTTVKISGQMPATAEVVVRLSGEGEELHLKRKGKVAGLLWMNTSDLTFENAPKVYMVSTGTGIQDLDTSAASQFSFKSLKNRIKIAPASNDNDFLLQEFIRLKSKEALYSVTPGGVSYGQQEGGIKSYETTMTIPSNMKPGNYSVDVAVVQDGNIIASSSKPLVLKQVGFPEKLSKMAYGNGLWFGIMSVAIAVMAGLFMGMVFKGKSGAH